MAQMHGLTLVVFGVIACGCAADSIAETEGTYYPWDGRRVLCGVGLDDRSGNDLSSFVDGIARAAERDEVLIVFAHKPGIDHSIDKLDAILSAANDVGLSFYTFKDLADPDTPPGAGLALTFDDSGVDHWYETRELLAGHGARVTYFVTRFHQLSDARIDKLHDLESDGHAIEAHGREHLNAPEYAEEHGMQAYLDDEFLPALDAMRAAGFDPTSFAYPFGARTGALDRVILDHVELVRSVSWTIGIPLVTDPCP